jgi:hypothetical protein
MTRIEDNPSFVYSEVLLASVFADLAYNHRDADGFSRRLGETGWEGITPSILGANGFSTNTGGYGVRDGLTMQSYAFAGKRVAADATVQFVIAFEGSNSPTEEPADWLVNVGAYGWSRYYASLKPLITEVIGQILALQQAGTQTQLILTGHSLGGAAAMVALADLLAPDGNLWPGSDAVLAANERLWASVSGWNPAARKAILDATALYSFGAPSFLIEPNKLGPLESAAFLTLAPVSNPLINTLTLMGRSLGALRVDSGKLPDLSGNLSNSASFESRAFQFEHANSSWYYPGDIVAQLGNRDPGTVLEINLDNDRHKHYTSWLTRFLPGGTHGMGNYQESVIRLATANPILKDPNPLPSTSPQLPTTSSGAGSDGRNDVFLNQGEVGLAGNDLFIFSQAGTFSVSGGTGHDLYSISNFGVSLTLNGAHQSGRDTLIFDLAGTPQAWYDNTAQKAIFSVTGSNNQTSSVTIENWDRWQLTDIFQINKPSNGRWSLSPWTDINPGPLLSVSPNNQPVVAASGPAAPTQASQDCLDLSLSLEVHGPGFDNRNLSLTELLEILADPQQRDSVVAVLSASETSTDRNQGPSGDTRFFRVGRNRFLIDATVTTGIGSTEASQVEDLLRSLMQTNAYEFPATVPTLLVESGSRSVAIPNEGSSSEDVVSLRASVIARPERVSTVAFVLLEAGEDPTALTTATLRRRAAVVLTGLEQNNTPALEASLATSTTLQFTEGQRLAFFEVWGDSIANADGFSLLQLLQLHGHGLELRSSLGLVLQLVAEQGESQAGLAAFAARDQWHAPVLNFSGLKPTDTLTGEVVLAREASFNTDGGFYRIETLQGAVRDRLSGLLIEPGDPGYREAALQQSIGSLNGLRVANNGSSINGFNLSSEGLTLLAPYAVVADNSGTRTYFAFAAANGDGISHFRSLGDNIFGLEDQFGGGDRDFDDLVVGLRGLTLA